MSLRILTTATLASTSKGAIDEATAGAPRVKLSDFGLARHVVDTESMALTAAGALLGTPHYMAPEQWTGRAVDPRTDVYAMGATFFHLLAGQPPFTAETRDDLCVQHCNEPPPRLTSLNLGSQRRRLDACGRACSLQAARRSLSRCRGDAPRHRSPAARSAERSGDPSTAA